MTRAKSENVRVRRKGDSTSPLVAEIERLEAEAERLKKEAFKLLHKPVKERDTGRIMRAWAQHLDKLKEARQLRLRGLDNISGAQQPESKGKP